MCFPNGVKIMPTSQLSEPPRPRTPKLNLGRRPWERTDLTQNQFERLLVQKAKKYRGNCFLNYMQRKLKLVEFASKFLRHPNKQVSEKAKTEVFKIEDNATTREIDYRIRHYSSSQEQADQDIARLLIISRYNSIHTDYEAHNYLLGLAIKGNDYQNQVANELLLEMADIFPLQASHIKNKGSRIFDNEQAMYRYMKTSCFALVEKQTNGMTIKDYFENLNAEIKTLKKKIEKNNSNDQKTRIKIARCIMNDKPTSDLSDELSLISCTLSNLNGKLSSFENTKRLAIGTALEYVNQFLYKNSGSKHASNTAKKITNEVFELAGENPPYTNDDMQETNLEALKREYYAYMGYSQPGPTSIAMSRDLVHSRYQTPTKPNNSARSASPTYTPTAQALDSLATEQVSPEGSSVSDTSTSTDSSPEEANTRMRRTNTLITGVAWDTDKFRWLYDGSFRREKVS